MKKTVCFRFDEREDEVWQSELSYYSQGHINQIHHFLHCIAEDKKPRYSGERGVLAVRCTLATIRSAQTGQPVKVTEIDENFAAYQR